MTDIIQNPIDFIVTGNLIPNPISLLADTTPFNATNGTLSVLTATTIDGHSLKRLKVVATW